MMPSSTLPISYLSEDWHIHSIASGHGTLDSVTDIAREAAKRGMKLIGISDHGPATLGGTALSYFRNLPLCEPRRFGVEIRYGAEANILNGNGTLDIPDEILEKLDYCIVSMHHPIYKGSAGASEFGVATQGAYIRSTYPANTVGTSSENTSAYIQAMSHPKVKILGHCDDGRFPVDYDELVKAAAVIGVTPELNNVSLSPDSYRLDCRANATRLLEACAKYNCPILLSSDSHGRKHIGEVAYAMELIKEIGFPLTLIKNLPT